MSNKLKVVMGHTNREKWIENGKFYKVKNKNPFNHNIDYSELNQFDFVPKIHKNDDSILVSDEIRGKVIETFSDNDLMQIGINLRKLHSSDAKFPKFNLRRRIKAYQKQMHEWGKKIPIIEDNYQEMMKFVKRMNQLNPCHNDMWWQNIIKDENGKIWFVDWEYATRGDKHFDLAYFIEACKIDKRQEEILISAYESLDGIKVIREWMPKYKRFCHWLTLCWAYAQDPKELPFDVDWIINKFNELAN